jgi:hypothetical protein
MTRGTMVIVPTLLTSVDSVTELLDHSKCWRTATGPRIHCDS